VFAVLALERASRVFAVEPDVRKVLPVAGCRFVIGYDDAIRGSFDAISIIDVLYKIPIAEWDALLSRIASRLTPGGTLIIKEMDPTERLKNRWNRLQERAASALGLTLGESFSYESPSEFTARLERHGLRVRAERIDRFYPHPHMLYVATAPT
jgi:SAM-dependent methyltransferase